jgi:arginase family enzyme
MPAFEAGIRAGSRRLTLYGGYNVPLEINPFNAGLKVVDCGDIPVTSVSLFALVNNGQSQCCRQSL